MQFAASVAPATPEYVPATQFTHTVEELAPATPEYVPAAQFTHTVEELAPTVVEYVPATQLVHMLAPATLEYVEAGHMVHANEPTTLLAPATLEYVEAGHRVHANEPTMFLKLPAAHAVHVPPSEPVYPKLHLQAASAELVLGEVELPGHVRQVVAATIPEYVPAAQSVHAALPVVVLYFPTPHPTHVPPSGPVYPALQTLLHAYVSKYNGTATSPHGLYSHIASAAVRTRLYILKSSIFITSGFNNSVRPVVPQGSAL